MLRYFTRITATGFDDINWKMRNLPNKYLTSKQIISLKYQNKKIKINMGIDRVHRLGARRRYSDKPRQIVVKFESFTDRETIGKAGMVLNNRPNI